MSDQTSPTPSLRVTFISHGANLNGAELSLVELVRFLVAEQVEVTVVCPRRGPLAGRVEALGATAHFYDIPWWVHRGDGTPTAARRWARAVIRLPRIVALLRRADPHVIVSNSSVFLWGAVAARILRRPHVWYVREFVEDGLGWHFDIGADRSYRLIYRLSQVVVANSVATARHVEERSGAAGGTVEVVYPIVRRKTEPTPLPDRANFHALVVGRVMPTKGQGVAVEACARAGVPLRVVGPEEGGYASMLRERAAALGADVRWLGPSTDVAPHYRNASVVIVASEIEGFGRVTVEAFQSGRPVLGSCSGGTIELVKPGENGELFPPHDVETLTELLRRVQRDRPYLEHLARGAVESGDVTDDAAEKFLATIHRLTSR